VLVLKGSLLKLQFMWYEFEFMGACAVSNFNTLETALVDISGSSSAERSLAYTWSKASNYSLKSLYLVQAVINALEIIFGCTLGDM